MAVEPRRRTAGQSPVRAPQRGWRPAGESTPTFLLLAASTTALLLFGLLMTFSASFVQSAAQTGDAFGIFSRQLLWCGIGLPFMVGAAVVDYRWWRRVAGPVAVVALAASVLVLVPGLGVEANGARRWFDLGFANFQPSELAKLAIPMWLAALVAARWSRLRAGDLLALLWPAAPILVLAAVLVMAGPDLETAVLLAITGGIVLYVGGLPGRVLAAGAALVAVIGALGVLSAGYRRARFEAWLDPTSYADTFGYQTVQGFIALGSGGWLGVGLGQGRGKWLYIPNAHTDFIFAIIGEELGLAGALAVLLLLSALGFAGVNAARRAPDPFGRLLASGITGWLLIQAAINIGSVVGLIPVTGVTLPLVSFGGSSLLFTMLGLGILASIARAGRRGEPAPQAEGRRDRRRLTRRDGSRQ